MVDGIQFCSTADQLPMCRPLSSLLQYCLQHKQYIDILTVTRLCYPCHDFIALFHSKKRANDKYFLSTIHSVMSNRPHSIYQYSNMAQRLSLYLGCFPALYPSLFWETEDKRNFKKFTILTKSLRA